MNEERRRFPTARSLKVEDLLNIYDGIIDGADKVLIESDIAAPLPLPGMPDELDGYLNWAEREIVVSDGRGGEIGKVIRINDPLPPDDMTAVDDLILGKMFSLFQNWTNYIASEVTRAKCIRDIQERHLKVIKSALAIYYREEKGVAAGLISDYVNVDERYVEVDAALLRIKVFYETAASREDQLRRTLNNISREQTRRKDELDRTLHDERGGRPNTGPWSPRGRDKGFRT